MPERVVKVGSPVPLAGLVSDPVKPRPAAPAVIILNSGVMHHVGTCRMSVRLARAFADSGVIAMRFDFSGIGDSAPRSGSANFEEVAREEVAEVMDFLHSTRGCEKFVLIGLCSGADAAYETALVDSRVVGMCQLDAYVYRNFKYYLAYYGPRIFKLDVWLRFLRRSLSRVKPKAAAVDASMIELPSYIRVFPPKSEIESGLSRLAARGVKMYNIFTGGQDECMIYEDQYKDVFRKVAFNECLKVDYYADCSHIVTEPCYQQKIYADIVSWFDASFLRQPFNATGEAA